MPDSLQLQLVRKRALARQQVLALQVAVHYENSRRVVIQLTDDDRHRLQPRQLASALSPVARDKLIAAVGQRACDSRREHAVLLYALGHLAHRLVIPHLVRVCMVRLQFVQQQLGNLL